ncbi:MAG: hypothetical protein FD181_477 [Prolixibacteraceae bacterium]|mgnify:FL=1|nr:MAG: hypothetical protein FD181_477 [Prolixibacteraceae bacterium]
MENFNTYTANQPNHPGHNTLNNVNPVGIPDTAFYSGPSMVQTDSALLVPTDTAFRFWEVELEEKIFVGDLRYLPDSTYLERISWKGLRITPREITTPGTDWLTIMLFLAFVILASVSAGFSKYIRSLFQSLINYPTAFRMFREKNYSILHGAFRLEVLFYFIFSIFVFQMIVLASETNSFYNISVFGKTFAVVVVYFLAKKLAYHALGSIFIDTSDTAEFLFNMDNFHRGAGIILFPIVALIAYFPSENPLIAVVLGVFTTLAFYIMLLKRGVSILLKKQFPIFYLFLYLCTIEFLPLLLIYKIAVG